MDIRKYQAKDKENLRAICIATANGFDASDEKQRLLLCTLYNDYYSECEPENVFVAVDDEDNAVGYILCCTNREQQVKMMKETYLPRISSFAKWHVIEFYLANFMYRVFGRSYPAHLHIDIFDGYQRMGLGTKLMDTLLAHLSEKGVRGVMLGVSASNQKGRSFYKKYGFIELFKGFGSVLMGKSITKE